MTADSQCENNCQPVNRCQPAAENNKKPVQNCGGNRKKHGKETYLFNEDDKWFVEAKEVN